MHTSDKSSPTPQPTPSARPDDAEQTLEQPARPTEIGGPKGLEPTRYGDWERKGRCVDF